MNSVSCDLPSRCKAAALATSARTESNSFAKNMTVDKKCVHVLSMFFSMFFDVDCHTESYHLRDFEKVGQDCLLFDLTKDSKKID